MITRIKRKYIRMFSTPEKYARFIGVQIGKGCFISTRDFSSEPYLVRIGNYCRIASDVSFFTHGGLWSQRKKHKDLEYFGKIVIGDYTYIGEGAKIMPGVTIGDDVIIGAGSVVTKSVESGLIAAGNPARVVGKTEDFVKRIQSVSLPTYGMNYNDKKDFLLGLVDEKFVRKN